MQVGIERQNEMKEGGKKVEMETKLKVRVGDIRIYNDQ